MGAREQDPNADTEGAKSNLKGLFNRNNQNRSNAGEKLETSKKPKLYKNSRGNLEHEKTRRKTTLDYGVTARMTARI